MHARGDGRAFPRRRAADRQRRRVVLTVGEPAFKVAGDEDGAVDRVRQVAVGDPDRIRPPRRGRRRLRHRLRHRALEPLDRLAEWRPTTELQDNHQNTRNVCE